MKFGGELMPVSDREQAQQKHDRKKSYRHVARLTGESTQLQWSVLPLQILA
jgi:hypothetical protein